MPPDALSISNMSDASAPFGINSFGFFELLQTKEFDAHIAGRIFPWQLGCQIHHRGASLDSATSVQI
jgi:hypothetical protein